jgi:superfamily II DNA/RNA helicase
VAEFAKRYTHNRKTLVFTPTVNAAERVARAFESVGLGAKVVHGALPPSERAQALEDFENGDLQYLINCMLITEGTDLPSCSAIIMARPTKSQQLYIQILGRALRLHDDKENALIIDLVGATSVNGMVSANQIFQAKEGETASDATARIEETKRIITNKAAAVHALLDPETQADFDIETIVSGSFNLFDVEVEELVEQVTKKAREKREQKERERLRKLPSFPGPGRSGSLLELDLDFLVSLESWATLPQYKGSYACVVTLPNGTLQPFYCDKSKTYDNGRYGFITPEPVKTFEEAELAVVEFTKTFPGTAGAVYYAQNKLQPNHPKRNKKASAEQIKFMKTLLKRAKIKTDEVAALEAKPREIKEPTIGVCVDWIDYLLLCSDARKQAAAVREYYRESS